MSSLCLNPISNYRPFFFVAEKNPTTTTVTAAIGQDLLADEIVSEHLTRYPFPHFAVFISVK